MVARISTIGRFEMKSKRRETGETSLYGLGTGVDSLDQIIVPMPARAWQPHRNFSILLALPTLHFYLVRA